MQEREQSQPRSSLQPCDLGQITSFGFLLCNMGRSQAFNQHSTRLPVCSSPAGFESQVADLRIQHPQLCPGENGLDLLSLHRAGTLSELLLGSSPLSRRLRVQNGGKGAKMSPGQWWAILEVVGRAGLKPRVFLSGNLKGPWCPQRDGTFCPRSPSVQGL